MRVLIAAVAAVFLVSGAGAQAPLPPAPGAEADGRISGTDSAGRERECLVEPYMVVNVGSPVDGVLAQVTVNRGDRVRKGQVVARLQSGVEAAAVKLSEARVEFGRRKAERNESLYEKQLISAQERDELVTEVRLREEELKNRYPGGSAAQGATLKQATRQLRQVARLVLRRRQQQPEPPPSLRPGSANATSLPSSSAKGSPPPCGFSPSGGATRHR